VDRRFSTFLLFGGAGLVGTATCRRIAAQLAPETVVVCALTKREAEESVEQLRGEHPSVKWVPEWGNLFVPTEYAEMSRAEIVGTAERRRDMLNFTFGPFEEAYARNHMAALILKHRPNAIVDCVNTATGISYQDAWESTARVRDSYNAWFDGGMGKPTEDFGHDLGVGLLSQATPQIIRHVRLLYRATKEVGTWIYVKVGTTGTGGMGLNIPYTHSEDRPSKKLLAKTAIAFAHTGLLFLLARTPDAPVVKEVKPAAMVGYRAVEVRKVLGPDGAPRPLYHPKTVSLDDLESLDTRADPATYDATGEHLKLTVVNTGENGLFAKGEFAAITAMNQMEFVTPEEIADRIVMELSGGNTGNDVIAALDGSVITPSYRAGLLRHVAVKDLQRLEDIDGTPSIAIGDLGPPELSKLLFEVWFIQDAYGDRFLGSVLDADGDPIRAEDVSTKIARRLTNSVVARQATSIGIPILLPDGRRFLRGPVVKVPEIKGKRKLAELNDPAAIEHWIQRGWIDLRPENMLRWQDRFKQMDRAREELARKGSAAVSRATYLPTALKIGDVVAWIFNNEMGGFRVK
jgi:hypothetical protein